MTESKVLMLGIGNLLWADEGFGVRVVEVLLKNYSFPHNVTVMDGGTQGIYLVQHVEQAEVLVVFDAIDFGFASGSLHSIVDDDVPKFMGAKKMSLHQTGFQEVLMMAGMLGNSPKHLLLIGVQPEVLEDYGGSLSPMVKAQIEPAIVLARQYLQTFGISITPRDAQAPVELDDPLLDIYRYEAGRPTEAVACRLGDERIVYAPHIKIVPPVNLEGAIPVPVDFRGQY